MAKSTLGKTVSRVGSSGGGRTYRQQRPVNFYAVVAVIAILGIALVAYSRYERQNPAQAASTVFPTVGSKGFNGLASEECGTTLVNLPVQVGKQTYSIDTNNVLQIAPVKASQAGLNATIGEFINQMPGYSFSASKLTLPGATAKEPARTFSAGAKCPAGTHYAGQVAYPVIAVWKTSAQAKATLTTSPSSVHITSYMLFSLAFEPSGISPARPSAATISAMFAAGASAAASSTTTTTH